MFISPTASLTVPVAPPHIRPDALKIPLAVKACLAFDVLVALSHVAVELAVKAGAAGDTDLFHVGREQNIPTWYASTKLAVIGFTLFCVACYLPRRVWLDTAAVVLGAALFAMLSVDEAASVHERVGDLVNTDTLRSNFVESGIWPILCAPVFIAAVLIVYRIGRRMLTRQVTALFAVGLAVLLGGAVGLELAANLVAPYSLAYHALVLVEESMEMIGGSILLWGAIRFAESQGLGISVDRSSG